MNINNGRLEKVNKAPNDNSKPKKGTVFTGRLKPNNINSTWPLSSERQQHKRILIVDDNSDIVFTLRIGLESDPIIQVYSFDNPVDALIEFKPNFYDLLLIDVNMPLLDGFQLVQNLVREGLQCQGLFYDLRRNKYGWSKRSSSSQEYRLFYQEAHFYRTAVKTY